MKKITLFIATLAIVLGVSGSLLASDTALAVNVFDQCAGNADSAVCKSQGDSATSMVQIVINLLLYVLGIIAVIMIVVGGIRYTTSNGNASQIKEAKDTILYSVVGLIVAMLSFAIVNFVLGRF